MHLNPERASREFYLVKSDLRGPGF
jgi:hypothetical protein